MHRAALAAARNCDLIHIQTPFVAHYAGLKAASTLGKPVLATYHTLFEEYLEHYAAFLPARWLRGQARAFSRRQCNALDAVVVPSPADLTQFSRLVAVEVTVSPSAPLGAACTFVAPCGATHTQPEPSTGSGAEASPAPVTVPKSTRAGTCG